MKTNKYVIVTVLAIITFLYYLLYHVVSLDPYAYERNDIIEDRVVRVEVDGNRVIAYTKYRYQIVYSFNEGLSNDNAEMLMTKLIESDGLLINKFDIRIIDKRLVLYYNNFNDIKTILNGG